MKKNIKKTGKTFSEKQQIMNILKFGKTNKRWMTTREIVGVANALGWTTPMDDTNRKAVSHPYSKILSMMTDCTNPTYYSDKVMCRISEKKGHKFEFILG